MLKVLELFAGIGACSKALENLGIEHEIVDAVEIDKHAIKAFNAIHGTNFEPQDITKWDKDIECDLIMHGSPCQDFSVAGKQAGGDEGSGTRSSLMYETLRIVEKLKPKYVIWENVKNLLSQKHRHNFDAYQEAMEKLGYVNYYKVLNAKDYCVPQNRERVFTVSILGDGDFEFPEPTPLDKKLKDVLENKVDEKYYLPDEKARALKFTNPEASYCLDANYYKGTNINQYLCKHRRQLVKVGDLNIKGQDNIKRVYSAEGVSPTLSTMGGGQREPKVVEPFVVASRGRNLDNPSDSTAGATTEQRLEPKFDGTTNTLTSVQKDNLVALPGAYGRDFGSRGKIQDLDKESSTLQAAMGEGGGNVPLVAPTYRIRKLTPRECYRLMGFDDASFDRASKVISNTQLYKTAGNSIVVPVLEVILKELLCKVK